MPRLGSARPPVARTGNVLLACFAPFGAVSAFHLGVKLAGMAEADAASKWLLMPTLFAGLVAAMLLRRFRPRPLLAALVLAGVASSWIGDVTISADLVVGLSFFLVAHLCYIAAFWQDGRGRVSWWSLLAIPWFAALLLVVGPTAGPLLPALIGYGAVLAAMAASATRAGALPTLGGVLFVLSDSLLAIRIFTPALSGRVADAALIAAYLAGQLLITTGILAAAARRHDR